MIWLLEGGKVLRRGSEKVRTMAWFCKSYVSPKAMRMSGRSATYSSVGNVLVTAIGCSRRLPACFVTPNAFRGYMRYCWNATFQDSAVWLLVC